MMLDYLMDSSTSSVRRERYAKVGVDTKMNRYRNMWVPCQESSRRTSLAHHTHVQPDQAIIILFSSHAYDFHMFDLFLQLNG